MKIAFATDHAAHDVRQGIIETIRQLGHDVIDMGVHGDEAVDYPDYAVKALQAFKAGNVDRVILMCGTGLGMAYVANRIPGVRCARCMDVFDARLSRAHNDANCLALRAREQDPEQNRRIVRVWLETAFEGGRHQQRVDKIDSLTKDL